MFNWRQFITELKSNPPSERRDQQNAAKFRAQKVAALYKKIQQSGGPSAKTADLIAKRRKQFLLMKKHQTKSQSKFR